MKKPAVFLDRDGTLTEEVGYVNHPDRLRFLPGASEAVRRINAMGWRAVVVTNQAGVAATPSARRTAIEESSASTTPSSPAPRAASLIFSSGNKSGAGKPPAKFTTPGFDESLSISLIIELFNSCDLQENCHPLTTLSTSCITPPILHLPSFISRG